MYVDVHVDSTGEQGGSGGLAGGRRDGSGERYSLSWTVPQHHHRAHGTASSRSYHPRS